MAALDPRPYFRLLVDLLHDFNMFDPALDTNNIQVLTAFAISFGAVMLGLAIAFGVGGGGIARRILDHWFPERATPDDDEASHL